MVSASQLCSVEKLVIGKGCARPGTNFCTNPLWPKKAGQKARIVTVHVVIVVLADHPVTLHAAVPPSFSATVTSSERRHLGV
jgi:hypothetical protein